MGTFSTTFLNCGGGTSTSWTLPGSTLVLYLYTVGCWTATCLYTVWLVLQTTGWVYTW